MKPYLGLFGSRGWRIYGGLYTRFGPGAAGVSARGTPWAKINARQLVRPVRSPCPLWALWTAQTLLVLLAYFALLLATALFGG